MLFRFFVSLRMTFFIDFLGNNIYIEALIRVILNGVKNLLTLTYAFQILRFTQNDIFLLTFFIPILD